MNKRCILHTITLGILIVALSLLVACSRSAPEALEESDSSLTADTSQPATEADVVEGSDPGLEVEPSEEVPSRKSSSASQVRHVKIDSFKFITPDLTIAAGDVVTWTHEDSAAHTVTADDSSFDSDRLSSGETFSFTFSQPGTYGYHCNLHPSMTGRIVVE